MLKSLKNRLRGVFIAFLALAGATLVHADGSIGKITFLGFDPADVFTAGTATNTVSNDLIFNILTSTDGIPSAGQTVTLSLIKSGDVVENGISNVVMTTDGTGTLYGGGARPPITFYNAGTVSIRATANNGFANTSTSFTVNPGTGTKLIMVGPGQTLDQGKNPSVEDGVSGSILSQESGQAFTVSVYLTDNQFNQVAGAHSITFPGPVTDVTLPADGSLAASGQGEFSFTITAPNTSRTVTARDQTDTGVADGTLSITTVGPPAQEVFPFPSPFNPTQGNITFRYRVTEAKSVTLIVTDIFGQKVWEQGSSGSPGINDVTWNGRNDKGEIVAAGVYYVLFETGGSIESKRRFGVIK